MKLSTIASTVMASFVLMAGAAQAAPVSVNGGSVHFKGELVNAAGDAANLLI